MNTDREKYIKIKTDYLNLKLLLTKNSNITPVDISNKQTGGRTKIKWKDLKHNGVMFYPEYEPHGIPIKYGIDKEQIILNPNAEEFITYYVAPRFDSYRNDRFKKNFFNDWKKLLTLDLRKKIKDFSLCDFSDIKSHVLEQSEKKKDDRKLLSIEEKDTEKQKNEDIKLKYQYAIVDGVTQNIDNYLVEPPTIFVGRGDHPLSGSIKHRIYPKDVTINIGKNMAIPVPKIYGNIHQEENQEITDNSQWGAIISDNTLEWIASWQNNVTMKYNYARFGRKSGFKMKSDEKKYDKARSLKKKIKKIRGKNEENMKSDDIETRQLSIALYLIDKLALRIGNEKSENEADTVGATTLKIKNIHIADNETIKFDFLGKDSIRYVNKVKVPSIVYKNIKEFSSGKTNNDYLFDKITSDSVNKYIKGFMKTLTAKVFRTFNASYLMQLELKKINAKYANYDKPDKITKLHHEYEMANLKVAKLCNHQRLASKSATDGINKIDAKLKDLQSQLKKVKQDHNAKPSVSLNNKITKLQAKIKEIRNKKSLKTESKTLSSSTSKLNYIDPRITIAFLKTNNIMDGIDKFFNKTQQKAFEWTLDVNADYKF